MSRPLRSAHLTNARRTRRSERGIVLAIVLVMIFALVTAVYAFQHRAIIDNTIAANRLESAEADALAKGGLRLAEVIVMIVRAKYLQGDAGGSGLGGQDLPGKSKATPTLSLGDVEGGESAAADALWQGIGGVPIDIDDERRLRIEIEDEGAKLNLNALVPAMPGAEDSGGGVGRGNGSDSEGRDDDDEPSFSDRDDGEGSSASEEAVEYLTAVIEYVIDGMEGDAQDKRYDPAAIAENILDFMDGDQTSVGGRGENEYYRRQDPPYEAWNRPLLSVDQLGLVENVDARLLSELRHYVTVHPIAGTSGININRAAPWVLKLVYAGTSGNMRLIDDRLAEDLYKLRDKGKLVCDDAGGDPRCVPRNEVGNGDLGNGSIYPVAALPAKPEVFRVTVTATVGTIDRRFEAIYDTRPNPGPQLLSWRRLRGQD